MSLDYNQKLNIDIETEKIDVNTIPSGLRTTHRFLLKFISIAPYSIDVDCTVYLIYKNLRDDTEFSLDYTVSKDETFFKQKLPVGIVAREWRLRVVGQQMEQAEFGEMEVLWIPKRIGDR
jgi:hypothetical protein